MERARSGSSRSLILSGTKWLAITLVAFVVQSLPAPSQTAIIKPPSQVSQNSKLTLQPSASAAPAIQYQDGLLTIEPNDAPLAEILRMVAKQTGARIDFPPGANERVFGRIGPGTVVEVLVGLLESTSFDYAILGPAAHPNQPVRVIVLKPAGSATPQQVQSAPFHPAGKVAETVMTGSEEVTVDPGMPSREPLEQRLQTITGNLLTRLNARGRQANPDSQTQQPE